MSLFKKLFRSKGEQKLSTQEKPVDYQKLESDIREQLISNEKKIMLVEVKTFMTSNQGADAENAFLAAGIMDENLRVEVLKQYTWHYLNDMDKDLQCTMQLVLTEALEKTKPFTDSRDIYEKVLGIKYKGFDEW